MIQEYKWYASRYLRKFSGSLFGLVADILGQSYIYRFKYIKIHILVISSIITCLCLEKSANKLYKEIVHSLDEYYYLTISMVECFYSVKCYSSLIICSSAMPDDWRILMSQCCGWTGFIVTIDMKWICYLIHITLATFL